MQEGPLKRYTCKGIIDQAVEQEVLQELLKIVAIVMLVMMLCGLEVFWLVLGIDGMQVPGERLE